MPFGGRQVVSPSCNLVSEDFVDQLAIGIFIFDEQNVLSSYVSATKQFQKELSLFNHFRRFRFVFDNQHKGGFLLN